jgi:hypothetical protein
MLNKTEIVLEMNIPLLILSATKTGKSTAEIATKVFLVAKVAGNLWLT